ncbi:MAG: phage tail assembly protein [Alphaproteobacteria bacterium]|nr:phage tail assembly protein [Alphaproteobacteria bacterium]
MTKIALAYPVNGVTHVELRRPLVKDILAAESDSERETELKLISRISSLSREQIEELDLSDYVEIQKVVMGFRKPGPATSAAPSSSLPVLPDGDSKKSNG